jgi:hypothetical protein
MLCLTRCIHLHMLHVCVVSFNRRRDEELAREVDNVTRTITRKQVWWGKASAAATPRLTRCPNRSQAITAYIAGCQLSTLECSAQPGLLHWLFQSWLQCCLSGIPHLDLTTSCPPTPPTLAMLQEELRMKRQQVTQNAATVDALYAQVRGWWGSVCSCPIGLRMGCVLTVIAESGLAESDQLVCTYPQQDLQS